MLDEGNAKNLHSDLTFEEVTKAVNQLSSGCASGIDGIPAEFYKTFWGIIGKDFFKVLQESYKTKVPLQGLELHPKTLGECLQRERL